jgi:hypothetical protein
MSETVLWGITGVSLGIAGTVGVFVLVMSAQLAKMGLRIRNEEKDRKRLVQNMQEATRIGAAYDATVAIRKFIEEEQEKLPEFFIETGDPDEPYMTYDLNLARRWMKPIRILLEMELAHGQHVVDESAEEVVDKSTKKAEPVPEKIEEQDKTDDN